MIQRIQTLYLLLVTVLAGLMLLLPLAWFSNGAERFTLEAFALQNNLTGETIPTLWLGILLALTTLVPFVTIFLFKRRLLQVRLCAVELVLLLGSQAMVLAYYLLARRIFVLEVFHQQGIHVAFLFPVVGMIFCYLALRAIMRDEVLVRSLDRIR